MTTLNKLTEQVRRLYARAAASKEDIKPLVEDREIKLLLIQATHELLSIEPKQSVKLADINIPSCMIATYNDNTVLHDVAATTYTVSSVTTSTVVATGPISTTQVPASGYIKIGTDIYSYTSFSGSTFSGVSPDPTGESGTISVILRFSLQLPAYPIHLPQDMGVWSVVSSTGDAYIPITTAAWDLLGSLDEGLIEDYVGYYVEGRKLQFTSEPSATVKVKLLIVDPALIGDNDPYPIPPEYESSIITRALEILTGLGVQPPKPKA